MRHLLATGAFLLMLVASTTNVAHAQSKKKGSIAGTALKGAGGFVFERAVDQLGPLALNSVGLGEVADFLFPSPEAIDYDKIAEIVTNVVHAANVTQTVREQNGMLSSAMGQLQESSVRNNENYLRAQLKSLADIMGVVGEPKFRDEGIATYVMAAQARIGAMTYAYARASGQKKADLNRDILLVVGKAKVHVTPYMKSVIDKRLNQIVGVREGAKWVIHDKGTGRSFGELSGGRAAEAGSALRNLIKYHGVDWNTLGDPVIDSAKWSRHYSPPAFVQQPGPGDTWNLFVRMPKPSKQNQVVHLFGSTYIWIDGNLSGNGAADRRWKNLATAAQIQKEAMAKRVWFNSFLRGWADLEKSLRPPVKK